MSTKTSKAKTIATRTKKMRLEPVRDPNPEENKLTQDDLDKMDFFWPVGDKKEDIEANEAKAALDQCLEDLEKSKNVKGVFLHIVDYICFTKEFDLESKHPEARKTADMLIGLLNQMIIDCARIEVSAERYLVEKGHKK